MVLWEVAHLEEVRLGLVWLKGLDDLHGLRPLAARDGRLDGLNVSPSLGVMIDGRVGVLV